MLYYYTKSSSRAGGARRGGTSSRRSGDGQTEGRTAGHSEPLPSACRGAPAHRAGPSAHRTTNQQHALFRSRGREPPSGTHGPREGPPTSASSPGPPGEAKWGSGAPPAPTSSPGGCFQELVGVALRLVWLQPRIPSCSSSVSLCGKAEEQRTLALHVNKHKPHVKACCTAAGNLRQVVKGMPRRSERRCRI